MTAITNTDNESGVTTMSCMINEDSKCELSNKNCNEEMNRHHLVNSSCTCFFVLSCG